MEKQLKKLVKNMKMVQDKARALLKGKTEDVGLGIKRATAFLELAQNEIEDFRRQYLNKAKTKSKKKSKGR